MKYLLSICLLLLLFVISNVTSQNSPSNCYYNGIDYSFLNLNDSYYTAYSAGGNYKYHWNVCGDTKRCHRGFGACQVDLDKYYSGIGNPLYLVGSSDESLFRTVGGYSILTYKTSFFPCPFGTYRDFNIRFICGSYSQVAISNVDEIDCKYYVNMTSSLFCSTTTTESPYPTPSVNPTWEPSSSEYPTPTPSETYYPTPTPSDSSWEPSSSEYPTPTPSEYPTPTPSEYPTPTPSETYYPTPTPSETYYPTPTPSETDYPTWGPSSSEYPTPTPSETYYPTPTPTETEYPTWVPTSTPYPTPTPTSQQITCRLTDYGLSINSTHLITCSSSGEIQCFTSTDTLLVESPSSVIKYSTTSGSIRCVGNHIECTSIYATCSINKSSYNGLNVNGIKTGSNYYDSSSN